MRLFYLLVTLLIFRIELAAQPTVLSILPANQIIGLDSTCNEIIKLENIQQLHAYSIEISYNPLLLKYQSINRMNFLGGWQTFFFSFIDTISGKIKVDEAILGPYVQSGSGELFKIIFKGNAEDKCSLYVTVSELRDLDNQDISTFINNAVVQIGLPLLVLSEQESKFSKQELNIFPNPFNSTVTIEIDPGKDEIISVKIFSCNGEQVYDYGTSSVDRIQRLKWNGKNLDGNLVPCGVYLIMAETSANFLVKKIIMLK